MRRAAVKCCQSTPRCRNCPARKIADDAVLRALGLSVGPKLPLHLQGVPPSLHKYEPLLRESFERRTAVGS